MEPTSLDDTANEGTGQATLPTADTRTRAAMAPTVPIPCRGGFDTSEVWGLETSFVACPRLPQQWRKLHRGARPAQAKRGSCSGAAPHPHAGLYHKWNLVSTGNAQPGEDVSAPVPYSRCGFVLEGHIRGSKLNPDGTVGSPQGTLETPLTDGV